MELLKLLNTNEIVAQILCFLIVFFLLRKFAWKQFLKLLDERRQRIAAEFKKIEDLREEIAKTKAEYQKNLSQIDEAAQAKIQEAIFQGKEIGRQIQEKAKQDAEKIMDHTKENIKQELAKAKKELKERVVELTITATEKIIKEKLSKERDKQLIAEFIEELEETK